MRYGTISHTPAPNICHLNLENFHALIHIISKISGQLRGFFLICLFVRILEQKLLSSGMHLTQCNFTYFQYYLNSSHIYTATQSEVVRPNRVSSQPCSWPPMSPLPSLSPMLPVGSSHLFAQEALSMEMNWGRPGTTSTPAHCRGTLHFVEKVRLRCLLLSAFLG